jgi:hypothetical protein
MSEPVKVKSRLRLRAMAWPESSNIYQQWQMNSMETRLETSTTILEAIRRGASRRERSDRSIVLLITAIMINIAVGL